MELYSIPIYLKQSQADKEKKKEEEKENIWYILIIFTNRLH